MADNLNDMSEEIQQDAAETVENFQDAAHNVSERVGNEVRKGARTISERIEVEANELVERVKGLVQESNVRRLVLRDGNGNVLLEVPLTAALIAGGALGIFKPLFAGLAAIAGLVTRIQIEVVRVDDETDV